MFLVEQNHSEKATSRHILIVLDIPGDLTLGQAYAVKDKLVGNPMFVRISDSFVSGYVDSYELSGRKLLLQVLITCDALWENKDDYSYVNKYYHNVDCLYFLLEREQ